MIWKLFLDQRSKLMKMNKVILRSISGTVFVLVMLAGLLLNRFLFATLFTFVAAGMIWEVFSISKSKSDRLLWTLAILFFTALIFLLAFRHGEFSGKLLLCLFIMIWSSDVGAFCIGSLLGQKAGSHKLAPTISPNKSWAGFWGGMAFTIIASLILHYFGLLSFQPLHCIAFAVIVHCLGVCGDLLESKLKRKCGVKDSSNLIPGHGGLLDRFDSSLAAIPGGCLYLLIFNLL